MALDAATGKPRFSTPLPDAPPGTTIHRVRLTDRAIFVAHGRRLELLDLETGEPLHRHGQ